MPYCSYAAVMLLDVIGRYPTDLYRKALSGFGTMVKHKGSDVPAVIEGNEGRLLVHTASLEADLADNAMYVW